MADQTYKLPLKPEYHEAIPKLRRQDPGDAETVFNPLIQKLLENTHFVKLLAQAIAEQNAADHEAIRQETAENIIAALDSIPTPDVSGQIGTHNQDTSAHSGLFQALADSKQDKLTGTKGQVVGFDKDGKPTPQAAPDTGVTSFKGRTGAVVPKAGDYTADQVGARPDNWTPTAADVGAVPTARKVNGKVLSGDISLTASDVGAIPKTSSSIGLGDVVKTGHDIIGVVVYTQGEEKGTTATHEYIEHCTKYQFADLMELARKVNPVFTGSISLGRKAGTDVGTASVAEGENVTASGARAHAEGGATVAIGNDSHAEGFKTAACGVASHSEGASTVAANLWGGHAEGYQTIAAYFDQIFKVKSHNASTKTFLFDDTYGSFSAAIAKLRVGDRIKVLNVAYGNTSNDFTVASISTSNKSITVTETIPASNFTPSFAVNLSNGQDAIIPSHAEGYRSIASGEVSHAEGIQNTASGMGSHAEGENTVASGYMSHTEGGYTVASGKAAHAEGNSASSGPVATASGQASHVEGLSATAKGMASHAGGWGTIASALAQYVVGRYNVEYLGRNGGTNNPDYSNPDAWFIVGNGTTSSRSNAFRVGSAGVWASGQYNSTGADYAELFEWLDGNPDNEDRVGRFVTLNGEKIRLARSGDDFILGVISAAPSVVGDVHDDQWQGMYLRDIFGRPVYEDAEVAMQVMGDDEATMLTEQRQKLNPDYDNSQPYIPRTQRPEWGCVGLVGKLVMVDDGTCKVNGWCAPGEGGIATASAEHTDFRVMSRLDDTHIRVLILGRR